MAESLRLQQKFSKGKKFKGVVSHVDNLSSFYIQVSPYDEFEDLQKKIQSYCEGITNRCFLTPKKGLLALGQYEGSWYRAKILEVTPKSAEILFVDFGNKSTVVHDQMLSLPPQYRELPFQAIHCNLSVPTACDKYSTDIIKNFTSLTEDSEIEGEVKDIGAKSSLHLVNLILDGVNVDEKLYGFDSGSERNATTVTSINNSYFESESLKESSSAFGTDNETEEKAINNLTFERENEEETVSRDNSIIERESDDKAMSTNSSTLARDGTKLETIILPDSYSLLKLPTPWLDGHTRRVIITSYEEDYLWCIDENDAESVYKLSDSINNYYQGEKDNINLPESIVDGEVYCVNKDGMWHRVAILRSLPNSGKCEVQAIDFGKHFVVEKENLKTLQEKFIWQPRCCRKLSLFNRGLVLNEDVINNVMRKLISSKSRVHIKIEKTEEDNHFVSITIKSLDLLNDILALPKAVCTLSELTTKFKDFPIDCSIPTSFSREIECYVSHVESVAELYIQPTCWEGNLEDIANVLQNVYSKQAQSLQLIKAEKGMFCVAKYSEDECFYRAKILSCEETTAMVHFIDYGNYDEVCKSQLFVLIDQITSRSQCIKCSLNNVKDTVLASSVLERVSDKTLRCEFYKSSDTLVTDLYDGEKHLNKVFSPDLAPINEKVVFKTNVELCPIEFSLEKQKAKLLHVDNPNTYFVRPLYVETKRSKIENIFKLCDMSSAPSLSDVSSGSLCAVKVTHPDLVGTWFRGRVLEVRGNKSRVRLLDDGKVFIFENDSLKVLPNSLLDTHACSVECHLVGLQVPENGWSKMERKVLTSAYPKVLSTVSIIFKNKAGGLLRTELYTPSGVNLIRDLEDIRCNLSNQDGEESIKSGFSAVSVGKVQAKERTTVVLPSKNLQCNVQYECYVSHYDNPDQFWIQLQMDEKEIEQLNSNLQALCKITDTMFTFGVGEYCCAFSNEFSSWYRCVVLSIIESEAKVRYVDFGNTEVLDVKNLVPLHQSVLSIPRFATKLFVTSQYTDEQSRKLKDLMGEESIIVKIKSHDESWKVEMISNEFGDLKQAVFESVDAKTLESDPEPSRIIEEIVDSTEITIQNHESISGDVQAFVSSADSPSKFWIQLVSDNYLIENVYCCLNEVDCLSQLFNPSLGQYCIAESKDDNTWYRAQITNVLDDKCEVLFVDYGNTETVSKDKLKVITETLAQTKKLAIEASLLSIKTPPQGWTINQLELFEKSVFDKELICRVCNSNKPIQVILNDGDQCINALFMESEEDETSTEIMTYPAQKIPATEEKGRVTHVNKNGDIFVQLNKDDDDLNAVFSLLEDFTKYPMLESIVNNLPVIALFEGEWFRATIIRCEPVIDVYFVDYGNSSTVGPKDLRTVDKQILGYPPLAYCFKGYASASVSQKTIENLLEIEDLDISFKEELRLNGVELMEHIWFKDKNLCALENISENQSDYSLSDNKDIQANRSEIEQRKIFENTYEDVSEGNLTESSISIREPSNMQDSENHRQASVFQNSPNYESFKDMACLESTRVDEFNSIKEDLYQGNEIDKTQETVENSKLDITEEIMVKDLVSQALTKVYNCLTFYESAQLPSSYVGFPLKVGQQLVVEVISSNDNYLVVRNLDMPPELDNLDGSYLEGANFEVSIPALALSPNGHWMRVKVLNVKDEICQVFSVDQGLIFDVPLEHLKVIEDEHLKAIPGQVFVCSLIKQTNDMINQITIALEERKQCIIDIEVESVSGFEPAYISIVSVVDKSKDDFSLNGTITIDEK